MLLIRRLNSQIESFRDQVNTQSERKSGVSPCRHGAWSRGHGTVARSGDRGRRASLGSRAVPTVGLRPSYGRVGGPAMSVQQETVQPTACVDAAGVLRLQGLERDPLCAECGEPIRVLLDVTSFVFGVDHALVHARCVWRPEVLHGEARLALEALPAEERDGLAEHAFVARPLPTQREAP